MSEALQKEPVEDDDPLQRNLTYRLARVQARLNAQAARLLKEKAGLSLTQWRILKLIRTYGQANASTLAKASTMDPGHFSRKVKTLIAKRPRPPGSVMMPTSLIAPAIVPVLCATDALAGRSPFSRRGPEREPVITSSSQACEDALSPVPT